jgi:Sec-independent protein secretion pathway component TatC
MSLRDPATYLWLVLGTMFAPHISLTYLALCSPLLLLCAVCLWLARRERDRMLREAAELDARVRALLGQRRG